MAGEGRAAISEYIIGKQEWEGEAQRLGNTSTRWVEG